MAIGIRVSLKGIEQTVARMQAMVALGQDQGKSRTKLHVRYGIQAVKWIDQNFRQQGALLEDGPWKELSPNTIAGRIKRSSRILQDRGELSKSFASPIATSTEVRIGSPLKVALWQNEGTDGPYPIVPRNKKALAFVVAGGGPGTIKVNRALARKSASAGTGRFKAGQSLRIIGARNDGAPVVMHPGLVPRRMLPRESEILPRLLTTTENWLSGLGVSGSVFPED